MTCAAVRTGPGGPDCLHYGPDALRGPGAPRKEPGRGVERRGAARRSTVSPGRAVLGKARPGLRVEVLAGRSPGRLRICKHGSAASRSDAKSGTWRLLKTASSTLWPSSSWPSPVEGASSLSSTLRRDRRELCHSHSNELRAVCSPVTGLRAIIVHDSAGGYDFALLLTPVVVVGFVLV